MILFLKILETCVCIIGVVFNDNFCCSGQREGILRITLRKPEKCYWICDVDFEFDYLSFSVAKFDTYPKKTIKILLE